MIGSEAGWLYECIVGSVIVVCIGFPLAECGMVMRWITDEQ